MISGNIVRCGGRTCRCDAGTGGPQPGGRCLPDRVRSGDRFADGAGTDQRPGRCGGAANPSCRRGDGNHIDPGVCLRPVSTPLATGWRSGIVAGADRALMPFPFLAFSSGSFLSPRFVPQLGPFADPLAVCRIPFAIFPELLWPLPDCPDLLTSTVRYC